MPVELNRIECARFGINAARVTDVAAPLSAINGAARDLDVDMLSVRVNTDDLHLVHALEADGYRLMDTLVYYSRELADVPAPRVETGEVIRQATRRDVPEIGRVAREAFAGYFGHYHSDPRLSGTAADAAYVEWAETSALNNGPSAPVLVAVREDEIAGFLAMRMNSGSEFEIVLNAVHPKAQRLGLYGRLIDCGVATGRDAGCAQVIVSTQINNIAVQKAWGKRGFRMSHSLYTFHKWFSRED